MNEHEELARRRRTGHEFDIDEGTEDGRHHGVQGVIVDHRNRRYRRMPSRSWKLSNQLGTVKQKQVYIIDLQHRAAINQRVMTSVCTCKITHL
jgi:primase-polymerase (primpol)-like protein